MVSIPCLEEAKGLTVPKKCLAPSSFYLDNKILTYILVSKEGPKNDNYKNDLKTTGHVPQ